MRPPRPRHDEGMALMLALFMVSIALVLLGALTVRLTNHSRQVGVYSAFERALLGVEAGAAQSLAELAAGDDGWLGIKTWKDPIAWPTFDAPEVQPLAIAGVEYFAMVRDWSSDNVDNNGDGNVDFGVEEGLVGIFVSARVEGIARSIEIVAQRKGGSYSIWDNAVFGGAGDPRKQRSIVEGDFRAHGPVHLLGANLKPGDYAMNLKNGFIHNGYDGMANDIRASLPPLKTVEYNGTRETLDATLRVKQGLVGIRKPASIGEAASRKNTYKESLDGVYVGEGWTGDVDRRGTPGPVYTDYLAEGYDKTHDLEFPTFESKGGEDNRARFLEDFNSEQGKGPHTIHEGSIELKTGQSYYWNATRNEEVKGDSRTPGNIPSPEEVQKMIGDGEYLIWFDAAANQMVINGRIAIQGDFNTSTDKAKDSTIYYAGKGSIMAMGDGGGRGGQVNFQTSMVSRGLDGSTKGTFPDKNLLGVMAEDSILIDKTRDLTLMGAFYAQDLADIRAKRAAVVGGIAANRYLFANRPTFYHVPALDDALDESLRLIGAGGSAGGGAVQQLAWREIGVT